MSMKQKEIWTKDLYLKKAYQASLGMKSVHHFKISIQSMFLAEEMLLKEDFKIKSLTPDMEQDYDSLNKEIAL